MRTEYNSNSTVDTCLASRDHGIQAVTVDEYGLGANCCSLDDVSINSIGCINYTSLTLSFSRNSNTFHDLLLWETLIASINGIFYDNNSNIVTYVESIVKSDIIDIQTGLIYQTINLSDMNSNDSAVLVQKLSALAVSSLISYDSGTLTPNCNVFINAAKEYNVGVEFEMSRYLTEK